MLDEFFLVLPPVPYAKHSLKRGSPRTCTIRNAGTSWHFGEQHFELTKVSTDF